MRYIQLLLIAAVGLALLAVVTPVQAATVDECRQQIASLRSQTAAVTTFTNAKDQTGLLGKLDSAVTKLEQGKLIYAATSLTQFRDKLVTLDGQGKIDPADAATLVAEADAAIACVQSLSASTAVAPIGDTTGRADGQ